MSGALVAGRIVNRAELATLCGKSLPTVDAWVREGCPYVERGGKGRDWSFNTADVFDWRVQQAEDRAAAKRKSGPLDPEQERARKDRALADAAELKNATTRGELVAIEDVVTEVERIFSTVRNRLLALPARIGMRVPIEVAQVAEQYSREELYQILNEVSAGSVVEHVKNAPAGRRRR